MKWKELKERVESGAIAESVDADDLDIELTVWPEEGGACETGIATAVDVRNGVMTIEADGDLEV